MGREVGGGGVGGAGVASKETEILAFGRSRRGRGAKKAHDIAFKESVA